MIPDKWSSQSQLIPWHVIDYPLLSEQPNALLVSPRPGATHGHSRARDSPVMCVPMPHCSFSQTWGIPTDPPSYSPGPQNDSGIVRWALFFSSKGGCIVAHGFGEGSGCSWGGSVKAGGPVPTAFNGTGVRWSRTPERLAHDQTVNTWWRRQASVMIQTASCYCLGRRTMGRPEHLKFVHIGMYICHFLIHAEAGIASNALAVISL